jgi:TusA-related sulfurtransferase
MAAHILDITKERCPMTFVKTKLALSKIASGDELELFLSGGEPLENIPGSVAEQGHQVCSVEEVSAGRHRILIRKQ